MPHRLWNYGIWLLISKYNFAIIKLNLDIFSSIVLCLSVGLISINCCRIPLRYVMMVVLISTKGNVRLKIYTLHFMQNFKMNNCAFFFSFFFFQPYIFTDPPTVRVARGKIFSEVVCFFHHVTHTMRLYNVQGKSCKLSFSLNSLWLFFNTLILWIELLACYENILIEILMRYSAMNMILLWGIS